MVQVIGYLFVVQFNGIAVEEECQACKAAGIIGKGALAFAGNGNGFLEFGVEQIKTFYRFTGFFNECLAFFS